MSDLAAHVQDAIDQELAMLYDDLNSASGEAIRGEWSMRCGWLLERIANLVSVGGSVPGLRETAMSAAFYHAVARRLDQP